MKTKDLLVLPVMLILTVLTAVAQNSSVMQHSVKDIIPFGKKLPPPDFTKHLGNLTPGPTNSHLNANRRKAMDLPDLNKIPKDPGIYNQQLLNDRKLQLSSLRGNLSPAKEIKGTGNYSDPEFHLTRDINALAEGNPLNNKFSYPSADSYAILDNVIYFGADDGIHGNELWRSDGTAEGTFMVKDIEPGTGSSFPNYIVALKGKLYFAAANSVYGEEPWVSDGTKNGTQFLMDLQPGPLGSSPKEFVTAGDDIYFVSHGSFQYWDAIWKTDGSSAGTTLIKDFGAVFQGYLVRGATTYNGFLFFTVVDFTYGVELWRSDGTDAGTYLLKNIGPFEYSSQPTQLTKYNDKLYFSADDGTGRKLWVTDGTETGTTYAPGHHDILVDADYFGITFPVMNNVLYIPGSSPFTGNGLFKYDALGSSELELVKDLTAGSAQKYIVPSEMVTVNNKLYFKVSNSFGGLHDELWSSGGITSNTWAIKKFQPAETTSKLTKGNGTLYFVKSDAVYGAELWKSNGGASSTNLVSDIFKGANSSSPACLTAFRGKLFFSAADNITGNELFMTDGTDKCTALVKDINTCATSGSYPEYLVALGHNVLFTAYERVHGNELYRSDGTAPGTRLLNDIEPGEADFYCVRSLSKNDAAYFIAQSITTSSVSIYKTNGQKNGLSKITPDFSLYQYYYGLLAVHVADNGIVFYSTYNSYAGTYELWRTDGSSKGNFLLSSALYYYDYLNVAGNTAFFVAGDEMHGYELWKSDGSPEGTMIVKDINPGVGDAAPGGLFAFKNEVYFGAYDGISGYYSFWKSNGTEAGTIKLREIDPTWGSDADNTGQYFCISNNRLYFSAIDHFDTTGTLLWKTNGSVAGTKPIKDINPLSSGFLPIPYGLTDVNGTVFFIADDGEHGEELWKTKGKARSTKLVSDINPGPAPGGIYNPTSYAGKLFFAKLTGNTFFLWSSDGTDEGTKAVDDAGISNVEVSSIVSAGKKLFVTGYTYKYGSELYVGKVEHNKEAFARTAVSDQIGIKEVSSFDAKVYPNPTGKNASLQIAGKANNVSVSITDASGKKLWQSINNNAPLLNLPTEKMPPGIYLVTITSGTETKIIKLVKQ